MTQLTRSKPLVTVLMSCFNAERWLALSVLSVLNQTMKDFEFIIIDDGSTDKSLGLMNDFAVIDPRIIVLTKPNSGLSDSLNIGIEMSRGTWIARIDADDIFEPNKLEMQIEYSKLNPDLVFIGTGLTIIDELGNKLAKYGYPVNHIDLVRNLRTARRFPPHASALYRRESIQALGGYRSRLLRAEDADLWLRLSEVGQLGCLAGSYVQVRKHTEQISHSENGRRQMIDARISTVASWLREFNAPDPIASNDEEFRNFNSWIEGHLRDNGLYEFLSFKNALRSSLVEAFNTPLGMCKPIMNCIKNPLLTIRFFWEQLFGESLPYNLAKKWLAEQYQKK